MTLRFAAGMVLACVLGAFLGLGGTAGLALAQGGEARFKLSRQDESPQDQSARAESVLKQPPWRQAQPAQPAQPAPMPNAASAADAADAAGDQIGRAGQPAPWAQAPGQGPASEPDSWPTASPEDDLPPPLSLEQGQSGPAPYPQIGRDTQGAQHRGTPLEITPIREEKLPAIGQRAEPVSAEPAPAKSAKFAKSAKSAKSTGPGQANRAKPFWLDERRPEVELSFKQGAVAFILGADVGRRGTYKSFHLTNPPRRVIDIPGRWRYSGPTRHPIRFSGVSAIRVGEHPEFLRIVFDYVHGESRPPLVQTTPDGVSVIYFWGE